MAVPDLYLPIETGNLAIQTIHLADQARQSCSGGLGEGATVILQIGEAFTYLVRTSGGNTAKFCQMSASR